jgi:transposase
MRLSAARTTTGEPPWDPRRAPDLGDEDGVMSDERVVAPTSRRYTQAQKEQAVRLVRQIREETGERHGAVQRVARQLGYGVETVRKWVNQADIDAGERPGTTTEDNAKIRRLEQENRELRRANEILRSASAFFAAELDRPHR